MRRFFFSIIAGLALTLGAIPAVFAQSSNQEKILSYQSLMTIKSDATLAVIETIKVYANGEKIRHGIYRDFPTTYSDRWGARYRIGFKLISVERDGQPEDYHFSSLTNGIRIYFGQKETLLSPGEYTYTFTYETNRQIGFFAKSDELYWNVTGTGWEFPIESASAIVELPSGAKVLSTDGYTGPLGAQGKDFITSTDYLGRPTFETTRSLHPQEGLTIVVTWPKGFVTPPTAAQELQYFINDNRGTLFGLIGFFILLTYYLSVWFPYGRDPSRGTIIPLYRPPEKMSPAAVRFISRMGFDNKALTVTIVDLAVKGQLTIQEESGGHTLKKKAEPKEPLTPTEEHISALLFAGSSFLELKPENFSHVRNAVQDLRKFLARQYETLYFLTNKKYFIKGLVLSFAVILASLLGQSPEKAAIAGFLSVWLTGWTFGTFFLLVMVVTTWRGVGQDAKNLGGAIFLTLFSLPFVFFEIFGCWAFVGATSIPTLGVILVTIGLNVLFYHLLKAPTLLGRKILDQIEGLKLFLTVTEKDRLKMLGAPQKTPELFEKFLPYAMALDVEQKWSDQFTEVLRQAAEQQHYQPAWYAGRLDHFSAHSFTSSLSNSFNNSVAASSSPPSSHSGHGGGHSGGGGGGGGGGGW